VSARQARLALKLPEALDGLVLVSARRVDLLLLQEPALAASLADDVLGPLSVLPAAARDRLLETLGAWLRHQGEVRPVAEELHVHVQTVRYRLAQLRELPGDHMASPEGRLELELALRVLALG
jgi:DNA-binding PucR family transcriptional regulator